MDTSKVFVEMCKKFHEQSKEEYETPSIGMLGEPRLWWHNGSPFWFDGEDLIRLFTQDQLQKIFFKLEEFHNLDNCDDPESAYCRAMQLYLEIFSKFAIGNYTCRSMEQLWLAFVMKEKYNKTWNGKEWIK